VHAVIGQPLRQLSSKSVARQGAEIQRANALPCQGARQVVNRAAKARLEQTRVIADQIDQGFPCRGDFNFGIYLHQIMAITN
jgi:hypothetical protein